MIKQLILILYNHFLIMRHFCGIYAANYYDNYFENLQKLQHRGLDGSGISYICNNNIIVYKKIGTVKEIYDNYEIPKNKENNFIIGHTRYSTIRKNISADKMNELHPFKDECHLGYFSIAHNGNIANIEKLKAKYNISNDNSSDTLILVDIIKIFSENSENWDEIFIKFMNEITGTYCLVILTQNNIYCMRDRYGLRPLCLGILNEKICVASETCAIDNYSRDINAGEIIKINENSVKTIYQFAYNIPKFCSFEYIYFLRKESIIDGKIVNNIRYNCGKILGNNEEIQADITLCLPSTAISGAKGFAFSTNTKFKNYIEKNKLATRTFILPSDEERKKMCNDKFILNIEKLRGKNIYLVDDSIVRGNTMEAIIKKLQGIVKEIHIRILSPPIISECYHGIDMANKNELIAYDNINKKPENIDNICKKIGATSLKFMTIDMLQNALGKKNKICTSCFDGIYCNELLDW